MDLRKRKSKKGFTLIELMVVIVIIGILVAIALPNFISAQDRAKVSSVKANMHTVQTAAETYAVDWGGVYPGKLGNGDNTGGLVAEGTTKNYWKDFKNPFDGTTGAGKSYIANSLTTEHYDSSDNNPNCAQTVISGGISSGMVAYEAVTIGTSVTKYYIYGGAKDTGKCVDDKGKAFTLTNQ
jgi:prepilin-type N-terminal cleavage/methylation domain-containing protein